MLATTFQWMLSQPPLSIPSNSTPACPMFQWWLFLHILWRFLDRFFKWINPHLHFFFSLSENQLVHTSSTYFARISPQKLDKLEWLWPSKPWQVECAFVSLIGSHTMLGQHCQPVPVWWVRDVCLYDTCTFDRMSRVFLHATAVYEGTE